MSKRLAMGRVGAVAVGLAMLWGSPAWSDEVDAPSIPVAQESCEGASCLAGQEDGKAAGPAPVDWNHERRVPAVSPFVNGTGYWGPSLKPGYD